MIKQALKKVYAIRDNHLNSSGEYQNALTRISWSRERMDDYSFELVQNLVDFAFTYVPFYNKIFSKVGYTKGDLRKWSDFERLPILTKEKLRQAIKEKSIFATDRSYKFTRASTTGSSGEPLTLFFDEDGLRQRQVNLRRMSSLLDLNSEMPTTNLWRRKKATLSDLLAAYLGIRMTIPVIDVDRAAHSAISAQDIDAIIDKIIGFNTGALRGYVSAIDSVARRLSQSQKRIPTLRHIVTAAEALDQSQWRYFESVFGCTVHNLYGGTEAPCVAVNIGASHEMSIFDDYYRLEIVDEDTNMPCHKGTGKILVTDLFMRGMPIIRYENGDLAEYYPSSERSYSFRSLKNVLGRTNDKFILPSGKVVHSHLWHIYFRDLPYLSRFRVTQVACNHIDIELVPSDWSAANEKLPMLSRRIGESFGDGININLSIVDHISLGKGEKFHAVRSLVDQTSQQ